jgi:diguanylate cyclase (GGDEF)-like protein
MIDKMDCVRQNILIVDDTRFNIQIIKDIFDNDYEIFCATSGKECLEISMANNIDLVLLDVIMPEMDGYEVCRRLKANPITKNIPVIFVSSMGEIQAEAKGLELGAIDYVIRPINSSILKMRVKNHLELKMYRDILEKQSLLDGLTGVANRRHLDESIDKEWQRALHNDGLLSMCLLDIDFFKKYNDFYGHLEGDACLRKVANALKDSLGRDGDLVARYGGEEFVVLLPSMSNEDALKLAWEVQGNIASLKIAHQMSEVSDYVTISIGIATVRPKKNMYPTSLIEKADCALYKAKNEGRNRIIATE